MSLTKRDSDVVACRLPLPDVELIRQRAAEHDEPVGRFLRNLLALPLAELRRS